MQTNILPICERQIERKQNHKYNENMFEKTNKEHDNGKEECIMIKKTMKITEIQSVTVDEQIERVLSWIEINWVWDEQESFCQWRYSMEKWDGETLNRPTHKIAENLTETICGFGVESQWNEENTMYDIESIP